MYGDTYPTLYAELGTGVPTSADLEAWHGAAVAFWHAVNRFDARTLEWFRDVWAALAEFVLGVLAAVYHGVDQAITDRHYRTDIREGNLERGVAGHRYRPVSTPVTHSWEAMRLAVMAEDLGSRRYALGFTS